MRLSLQIAVAVLVVVVATSRHGVVAQYYGQFEECAYNGGVYDEVNG
jgi:hypothetical protein